MTLRVVLIRTVLAILAMAFAVTIAFVQYRQSPVGQRITSNPVVVFHVIKREDGKEERGALR